MKTFSFAFLMLLTSTVFISCSDEPQKLEDIDWLIGKWEGMDMNSLIFVEEWSRAGKNSFYGKGASIKPDGDTLFKEDLKIEVIEGTPYYVAKVPQNPAPVLFRLIGGNKTSAIFENPEHDFPKRIVYTLETNNTMTVKLEGIEKGVPRIEQLSFERNKGVSLQGK